MARCEAPVAIATCSSFAGRVPEDLQLIASLGRKGIEATHVAWDDRVVNWSSFGLVVIRSTWDYPDHPEDFLGWASQLPKVLNPLPILKWNIDKRYLTHFANRGLPVIPTCFLEPGNNFDLPTSPFVIKPAVSCGAKDTVRYHPNELDDAHTHVRRLQSSGRTVMVQPYLPSIELFGETAIVFLGGRYSHAIRRDAVLRSVGPGDKNVIPVSNVRVHEPTPQERRLADEVMDNMPGESSVLLYSRVDMIPGPDGAPVLMELELMEPSLFLEFSDGAVERFANCISAAIHSSLTTD